MGEEFDSSTDPETFPIFVLGGELSRKCYNFEKTAAPRVRHDGRLLYIASWSVRPYHALQAMVPDDFDEATGMRTRHEDELVPTPACPEDGTRGVAQFALHPLTGETYYACDGDCPEGADAASCPAGVIYDASGHERARYRGLLAVSTRGALLLSRGEHPRDLEILGPGEDVPVPVEAGDGGIGGMRVVAARSHGAGFRIVTYDQVDHDWRNARLWHIASDGTVRLEGRYPDVEPHYRLHVALDAEGNLYQTGFGPYVDGGSPRQVHRQALGASTLEILFDESAQPSGIPLLITNGASFPTGF